MNFCNIKENLLAYRAETGGHPLGLDRVFGFALIRAWVYLMFVGAAASFMTAPIGARLSHSLPTAKLKKGFAVFLIIVALRMLVGLF